MTLPIDIFASAIIYCSSNNIERILDNIGGIYDQLQKNFQSFELILVNNTTHDLDSTQLERYLNINILNLSFIHSLDQAMTAGADLAIGDFLFEFDYLPTTLPNNILREMLQTAFDEKADIVVVHNTAQAKMTSKIFYRLLHTLKITNVSMGTDLIRLISRRTLNSILKERRNFRFRKLLYAQSGYKTSVLINNRLKTFNNGNSQDRWNLASDVIASSSKIGSSVSKMLSGFFLIITILIAFYAIFVRLSGLPLAEGWTTMMLFLCVAFSGIFMILSVIARTAELALSELQNAQPYRVRDVVRVEHHDEIDK